MNTSKIYFLLVLLLPVTGVGCATLEQIANLRRVDFHLDRVTNPYLAGVNLEGKDSYEDVAPTDLLRLGLALQRGELPLSFTLHLLAENPEENNVQARLVQMDWQLFLEGRETISGVFNDDIPLPPGSAVGIPISMELDLLRFFDDNLPDLVELVMNLYGQGGAPKEVQLRARPTIQTPLGPIRYPEYVTIVSRQVGS